MSNDTSSLDDTPADDTFDLVDEIAKRVESLFVKRIMVIEANLTSVITELRSINERLSRLESARLSESFTPLPTRFTGDKG